MNLASRKSLGFTVSLIAAAGLLAGCSSGSSDPDANGSPQEKVTLQFSTFLAPLATPSIATQEIIDAIAEESDGTLLIEPFWEGSLLGATDGLPGIGEGRADIGYIAANYSPAEMPLSQLHTVPFTSPSSAVSELATAQLMAENEALQNEFSSNGVHPLATVIGGDNIVLSTEPVPNLEWFDGKSVRATGYIANLLQASDANAVALPVNEVYESMERGLIDGISAFTFDNITAFSFQEVATNVTGVGTGPFFPGFVVINQNVWDGLSASHQALLEEHFGALGSKTAEQTLEADIETCDLLLEAGSGVEVWPESEVDKWKARIGDTVLDEWKAATTSAGLDADAFYDAFSSAIEEASAQVPATETGLEQCAAR